MKVLLAFGSNLGDRKKNITGAWETLSATEKITTLRLSSFYETEPLTKQGTEYGVQRNIPSQPKYINAAGLIETDIPPLGLLRMIHKIEADFGRVRKERWGSRTLDIDILLYGNLSIHTQNLTIPHPEMFHRQFVLQPACEIAGDDDCFAEILAGRFLPVQTAYSTENKRREI